MAHGALLLRPMWPTVRRRGLPWTRWKTVLPQRLLRHVCAKVQRLQSGHHGKLHFSVELTMASGLLRLPGKWWLRPFPITYLTLSAKNVAIARNCRPAMTTHLIQCFWFAKIRIAKNQLEVNPSTHPKANQYVPYAQESVKRNRYGQHWNATTLSMPRSITRIWKMNAPVYFVYSALLILSGNDRSILFMNKIELSEQFISEVTDTFWTIYKYQNCSWLLFYLTL